ncbi:MAG TPA: type VII secretion target [Pseudonocardiaceae bacterium]|jgi:hypothetical protein|nr:type VII secretion target [Pseudonocardiaceae bacterium]
MTENGRFQLDPEQLRTHAASVSDLAGQLSTVAGGQTNGLSDNALGPFVQFLTSGLQDAMGRTTDAITGAASGVDNVSMLLGKTVENYQNRDQDIAGRLTAIRPPAQEPK